MTILIVSSVLVLIPQISPPSNSNSNGNPNGNTPQPNPSPNNTTPLPPSLKTLNKQIPPNYVLGNPIDLQLTTGLKFIYLETLQQKASIRFTATETGEVNAIALYMVEAPGRPTFWAGLQYDHQGLPSGEWIASEIATAPSQNTFVTIGLKQTAILNKGTVYHIVVEPFNLTAGDRISVFTYAANSPRRPLNLEDPDINGPDPSLNTLFHNGVEWKEQNKWPIFVVKYADGRVEGQPYSLTAPWVIYASTRIGEMLWPASNYTLSKIAFVVSFKETPTDKLYYEIRNGTNALIAEGIFAQASQLTTLKRWIEITLVSPVNLTYGQLYRIVLYSPGTSLANAYRVYGHEFSYNTTIGYGGLQHQLTQSHDGGKTWIQNSDADAIFKLTTVG